MPPAAARPEPEFRYVSPESLRFDPTNPRFGGQGQGKNQDQIQTMLEREPHYALELVESFLENGFIDYEPLVVRRDGQNFVVVEGNRRLAALRHILSNRPDLEKKSTRIDDLQRIPVLIFPAATGDQEEKEQRVYLGVRHLFGFREWPAESKARFLDANIHSADDLVRTMRELNIKRNEVRRYLVPFRVRRKARALWEPYRNQDFWTLGEGLNRRGIREYLELDVDSKSLEVKNFSHQKLKTLFQLMYGVPESSGKFVNRRIRETRDLSVLSNVLKSKRATTMLEKGGSLEEAALFFESPEESLVSLRRLVGELRVLLKNVLAKRPGAAPVLTKFDAFEESVKTFIRDAKKRGV